MGYILILGLIAVMYSVYRYNKKLVELGKYARKYDLEVFGRKYSIDYGVFFDITFPFRLWDEELSKKCDNEGLRYLLDDLRFLLKFQLYGGLALFILALLYGVFSNGGDL